MDGINIWRDSEPVKADARDLSFRLFSYNFGVFLSSPNTFVRLLDVSRCAAL